MDISKEDSLAINQNFIFTYNNLKVIIKMNNNELRSPSKVVIDPGHGGSDSGASGNNLLEKDYNLLISKYMYNRFKNLGVPVAITREEDVTLSPTERVNNILSKFGNSSDVILISNHVNAGGHKFSYHYII